MSNKIYFKHLASYEAASEYQQILVGKDTGYQLEQLPTLRMQEEMAEFLKYRSKELSLLVFYSERGHFNNLCRFLQRKGRKVQSFCDRSSETWIRQLKSWMMEEGIPLRFEDRGVYGNVSQVQSPLISYLQRILKFLQPVDNREEKEKDIWELEKLDIPFQANPIKNYKTINFTKVTQMEIREELKKGIHWNLQVEAISSVQKEMTAMRRLSRFLMEKYPAIQSCEAFDRELFEEYLTYLKTEETTTKEYHADLCRLRAVLESIGKVCDYPHLESLFINRDIPPVQKSEFRTYSDEELKRLNAHIVKQEEQIARAMVIHQMLGTRISDTLTLQTDCLYEKGQETIIRIRQMKTKTFEKPISRELATLIRKAIEYTKEKYGEATYIFVNDKNPEKPLQYNTLQRKIVAMIHKEDLRDDNGKLFGFGTHMYRHYYSVKLTEMHLDDWTLARLLGHSSVRNVKYYRRMGNQILADETRKARQLLSDMILENLDGWEEEYEQIRQDDSLK